MMSGGGGGWGLGNWGIGDEKLVRKMRLTVEFFPASQLPDIIISLASIKRWIMLLDHLFPLSKSVIFPTTPLSHLPVTTVDFNEILMFYICPVDVLQERKEKYGKGGTTFL